MTSTPVERRAVQRVAISSYLGTTLEYYDFLLYGTAAALVFSKVFFSDLSPVVGTIVALGTLAAGYLTRFVGALVFGHFGDRLGRKNVMLTTLIVMGITSGLIGCLPTYAQIGVWAPLALVFLRMLQGFAVGGEYGGAVLMISEHARDEGRGLASSAASMGAPSGSILATTAMLFVARLPEDQLLSWGWRIPFLCSFAFLAVALYFRLRITESPVFLSQRARSFRSPVATLLRTSPIVLVKSILVQAGAYAGQGVFGIYIVTYAPSIGYERSTALTAVLATTACSVIVTPLYAMLSDRVGRRPVLIFGIVATLVTAFPAFYLINMGNPAILITTVTAYGFIFTATTAVAPVYLAELFATNIRYTAVSTSYQLAQILGAGSAPVISASLLAAAGGGTNTGWISIYLVVLCAIGLAAVLTLPERHATSLYTDTSDGDSTSTSTGQAPLGTPTI